MYRLTGIWVTVPDTEAVRTPTSSLPGIETRVPLNTSRFVPIDEKGFPSIPFQSGIPLPVISTLLTVLRGTSKPEAPL